MGQHKFKKPGGTAKSTDPRDMLPTNIRLQIRERDMRTLLAVMNVFTANVLVQTLSFKNPDVRPEETGMLCHDLTKSLVEAYDKKIGAPALFDAFAELIDRIREAFLFIEEAPRRKQPQLILEQELKKVIGRVQDTYNSRIFPFAKAHGIKALYERVPWSPTALTAVHENLMRLSAADRDALHDAFAVPTGSDENYDPAYWRDDEPEDPGATPTA